VPASRRLSAIVPVLNEAARLPALLAGLGPQVDELIVVDGGSRDDSDVIARQHGATVLPAPSGRGHQLGAGAAAADGELLWFVHADSMLPQDAGAAIRSAVAQGAAWGCLSVAIDSRDLRLGLASRGMNLRARLTGSCTGDMGMWATRALYEAAGGFDPLVAFEDLVFADRARRLAPCTVLAVQVHTSARRWQRGGVWRTIAWMWALRLLYRAGVPPARLASAYQRGRR